MNEASNSLIKLVATIFAIFLAIQISFSVSPVGFFGPNVLSNGARLITFIVIAAFMGSLLASIFTRFNNKLYTRILVFSFFLLIATSMYIVFDLMPTTR